MKVAITPSSFATKSQTPLDLLRANVIHRAKEIQIVPKPFGRRLTAEEAVEPLTDVCAEIICLDLDKGRQSDLWGDTFKVERYSGLPAGIAGVLLTPDAATYAEQRRLSMDSQAVENILRVFEL